jgi:hypothetical protein
MYLTSTHLYLDIELLSYGKRIYSWVDYNTGGSYLNTDRYSGTPGDSAALSFNGSQISLDYTSANTRGNADIYIDGNLVSRLNMYSATFIWQSQWNSSVLTSGQHIIWVVCVDTYIDVDAFIVGAIPTPTATRTVTPTRTTTAFARMDNPENPWIV